MPSTIAQRLSAIVATFNSKPYKNEVVRYDAAQTLTDAQKAQARSNIGAADSSSSSSANFVPTTGSRGTLAGYESTGTATTINNSSSDSNVVSSNVTVENGSSGTAWTKIALLTSAVTVTLGSNWAWANGEEPTIVANSILVCTWCDSKGIATLLSPSS